MMNHRKRTKSAVVVRTVVCAAIVVLQLLDLPEGGRSFLTTTTTSPRQEPVRHVSSMLSTRTDEPTFHKDFGDDSAVVTFLPHIDRVLCLSDWHTDHVDNLAWLADRTGRGDLSDRDLIVVAGDVSHDPERMEESFRLLLSQTGASVLFVAGNHEAWLSSAELKASDDRRASSIHKLERVYRRCRHVGVWTGCVVVGGGGGDDDDDEERPYPLWIVPLDSWYDGSLAVPECDDLVQDFPKWPWVDFMRCRWPFPDTDDRVLRKIPSGLCEFWERQNQVVVRHFRTHFERTVGQPGHDVQKTGIMTVSHFLPNQQCLPDWKDVTSKTFDDDRWLDHGGGGVSAKFALVAGTQLLERQIRSVVDGLGQNSHRPRHLHVFGHSHRPKDFELDHVRYIHNPLGKPREREIHMVDPQVDFQTVWDTRTGEVKGETVIRYWEEKGGGVEMLRQRMKQSKRKSRYKFKGRHATSAGATDNTTADSDPSRSADTRQGS